MKVNVYADPGHGWGKIPIKLILELGIKCHISSSSYILNDYAYLEEDRDLAFFVETMKKAGKSITFVEHHTNRQSRIRNYKSYNTFEDQFNEDFHYNVPLDELDFVELSDDGRFYEVNIKGRIHNGGYRFGGMKVGPSIRKFRATKTLRYSPPYLVIR